MTELERIKLAVKALVSLGLAKNQEGIGLLMGYKSKSSFSQVLTGKVPLPSDFISRLCNLDGRLIERWLVSGIGDILNKQVYIDSDNVVSTDLKGENQLLKGTIKDKDEIIAGLKRESALQSKEIVRLEREIKELKTESCVPRGAVQFPNESKLGEVSGK